jgi:hypothetical protein
MPNRLVLQHSILVIVLGLSACNPFETRRACLRYVRIHR